MLVKSLTLYSLLTQTSKWCHSQFCLHAYKVSWMQHQSCNLWPLFLFAPTAGSVSISSHAQWANPGAEHTAAHAKGWGSHSARLHPWPLPQNPRGLPECQLHAAVQTYSWLQGGVKIPNQDHELLFQLTVLCYMEEWLNVIRDWILMKVRSLFIKIKCTRSDSHSIIQRVTNHIFTKCCSPYPLGTQSINWK